MHGLNALVAHTRYKMHPLTQRIANKIYMTNHERAPCSDNK